MPNFQQAVKLDPHYMPAQVALAWLIGHGNVVAIPGARTVAQLEDNVAAAELELSGAEMERLTAVAVRFEAAVGR